MLICGAFGFGFFGRTGALVPESGGESESELPREEVVHVTEDPGRIEVELVTDVRQEKG